MLISKPKIPTCTTLANTLNISHDSANRFLQREQYGLKDLFNRSKRSLNLKGGIISIDDTVLDRSYSQHTELVGYYYSGKYHKAVKANRSVSIEKDSWTQIQAIEDIADIGNTV